MQTRLVKTIILHPRYNRAVVDYDISIVELNEDINETSYVRPVCLPSREQLVEPDTYCYITGWGHMGNKSKMNAFQTLGGIYPSTNLINYLAPIANLSVYL